MERSATTQQPDKFTLSKSLASAAERLFIPLIRSSNTPPEVKERICEDANFLVDTLRHIGTKISNLRPEASALSLADTIYALIVYQQHSEIYHSRNIALKVSIPAAHGIHIAPPSRFERMMQSISRFPILLSADISIKRASIIYRASSNDARSVFMFSEGFQNIADAYNILKAASEVLQLQSNSHPTRLPTFSISEN